MNLKYTLLILFYLSSCCINKSKIVINENQITANEIKILSGNCEYVNNSILKYKLAQNGAYYKYDFRIVNLLIHTNCFIDTPVQEFMNKFGKASRVIKIDTSHQIYFYEFLLNGHVNSECALATKDGIIYKSYCMTDIKVSKLSESKK